MREVNKAKERVIAQKHQGYNTHFRTRSNLPTIPKNDIKKRYDGQPVIALNGLLVDVGKFASKHAGGQDVLTAGFGGRDLSERFQKLNHHTEHAIGLVEDMAIAIIDDDK